MSVRPLIGAQNNHFLARDHDERGQSPTYDPYASHKDNHLQADQHLDAGTAYDFGTPYMPYAGPGYSEGAGGQRYAEPWSYPDDASKAPSPRSNPTEYNPLFEPADAIEMRPLNSAAGGKSVASWGQASPARTRREELIESVLFATGIGRILVLLRMKNDLPVQEAINRKRHNILPQKCAIVTGCLTAVMTGIMIWELVINKQKTGSVIATKPNFNYMIGPSSEVLINLGARFVPCMKVVDSIPPNSTLRCIDDTSATSSRTCSLESLCGHGGFPDGVPDQSWRFITPIFLHVGVIHLVLNMLAQWMICSTVERMMGSIPFLIVYMAGGYYGFVLGGNFSRVGIPSAGASGAIFAIEGCNVVDLAMHWRWYDRPLAKAVLFFLEFVLIIAMGYIPFAVDGLAHLGGLAMGLLLGVLLIPAIKDTKQRSLFVWLARAVALTLAILALVLTTKNFYTKDPNAACQWCRFLSCFPTSSNDRCKGTIFETRSRASSS